ncbi:MAG: exodeoxyribonuclease VII large subunit [Pseudobutyrivibrio sp.]|nr:exodeoxyribonuclease VII large subunit [Pseudobutyrivibrio sp.]
MNKNIYSVSQVNTYIERMFADDFMLGNISVTGEVSNCKYNHTGHIYFTLKDENSAISCVMFAGKRPKGLKFAMKDGDAVVVNGYVGVYPQAGRYQVYANEISLAGMGDLYQKFEALKEKLEEQGMFSDIYKKPIPSHPMKIGIVTASTGAAVHDIIRVSKARNPYVQLILYPAQVQGQGAAPSIISGINALDEMNLDVIIVGRGGGSIEDLWAFNEEEVARAIFRCQTPVISAVGHETDFTIADFVADKRAATPSQAAEMANFVYEDFVREIDRYSDRLNRSLDSKFSAYTFRLETLASRLKSNSPKAKILAKEEQLNNLRTKFEYAMSRVLDKKINKLMLLSERLEGLSPAKKIAGGFGYITDSDGKKVDTIAGLEKGQTLVTRIKDGSFTSQVIEINQY